MEALARIAGVLALVLALGCESMTPAELSGAAAWGQSFDDVLALPAGSPARTMSYGDAPDQFVELWLPPASSMPLPVVVLVHGGCWLVDYDITHVHALSEAIANRGFAVWSVEYRRHGSPGAAWPMPLDDVALAVTSLPALAGAQMDLSRVAMVGHSAGGHLALLAATRLETQQAPALRGVVGLAAITDLAVYGQGDNSCQRVVPQLLGGSPQEWPERYALASPVSQPAGVSALLLHGDADSIVPLAQSREMPGASLQVLRGAGHFDLIHPRSPAFEILVDHLGRLLAP